MGAFSKALKDAQYLKPFADSLSEYKKRLDEQKGREALIQLMDNINKQQEQLFTNRPEVTAPANDFEAKPQSGGTFSNLAPQLTEIEGQKPYVAPQRPQILQPGQTQDPGFTIQERAYNPTANPNDYREAINKRNKFFSTILTKYATDPNIKKEDLNQILQIAQLGVPSQPIVPTSEIKEYDPKKDRYRVIKNPDGTTKMELIKEGVDPTVRNQWTKVGQGSEGGKDYALMRNFVTGETQRFLLGDTQDTRTNVNITNQGFDEGMRKIRIAQTEADLRSWLNDYAKLDKDHKEATDENRKKKTQEEKSRILRNEIQPRVKEITSLVAQEFPSFVGTMERYLGDTRIHKNPKLIESEILPEMREAGIPERMRYLVRDLLKSQIFSSETLPGR